MVIVYPPPLSSFSKKFPVTHGSTSRSINSNNIWVKLSYFNNSTSFILLLFILVNVQLKEQIYGTT